MEAVLPFLTTFVSAVIVSLAGGAVVRSAASRFGHVVPPPPDDWNAADWLGVDPDLAARLGVDDDG